MEFVRIKVVVSLVVGRDGLPDNAPFSQGLDALPDARCAVRQDKVPIFLSLLC